MKKRLLLVVIYLAFISLGLPDSLLGSAWPSMFKSLNVPIHFAGIISMIVASGTVISSLFSARFIQRFGVATITTISVLMTALALLGFAHSENYIFICFLAIPLGLGAGCVDVALNNYVALHFRAIHMNWLHCFWGVGAAIGPILMARYLAMGQSWTKGYSTVGWVQMGLVIILLMSIPLWVRKQKNQNDADDSKSKFPLIKLLSIPGIKSSLAVFFCYCTIEATFGLWGASYLVLVRDFKAEDAAKFVAIYYAGITIGRFISGFASLKMDNQILVKLGQGLILIGILTLALPFQATILPGFFLIGFGCAPIFPSLLHNTPHNFGKTNSESIMGLQMASAYIGITIMPFVFGKLASFIGFSFLIWFLIIILAIKIYMNMDLNKRVLTKNYRQ
ncbi:MFS transporter [Cyclobacterium plantarum]|uniref:MFS transporter n=1 Tax=Cyclobacterium plantarum TaxID=2716263 RepID=UPI003F717441